MACRSAQRKFSDMTGLLGGTLLRSYLEKCLSEFYGLCIVHKDFGDDSADFCLDLIHDLHGLDDAHHRLRPYLITYLNIGR